MAELRQVTVLFVKLSSLTFSKEKELDVQTINNALCLMQSIIFKYEGFVRQFLVDDKGTGIHKKKNFIFKYLSLKLFFLLFFQF